MRIFAMLLILLLLACQSGKVEDAVVAEEEEPVDLSGMGNSTLSSYGFFSGELKELEPAPDVHPYSINSALFSDYALKKRFVRIPNGKQAAYQGEEVFDFPEGTVLIKNFYYPGDLRQADHDIRLLETRLLMLKDGTWNALTYVWNEEQTEAFLDVAGASIPVSWIHTDGKSRNIDYSVPDVNQCKSCHLKGDKVMPIGPSARQLNLGDQLTRLRDHGVLSGLPDLSLVPHLVSYEDEQEPIAERARAWLEINCAHCHRPDGQAKTSGLFLAADITSMMELGVGKAPVAAGKGSGGRSFSIVPGRPDESILVYRIESTDPGIMMPEMGRKLVHAEGVELVREWILALK